MLGKDEALALVMSTPRSSLLRLSSRSDLVRWFHLIYGFTTLPLFAMMFFYPRYHSYLFGGAFSPLWQKLPLIHRLCLKLRAGWNGVGFETLLRNPRTASNIGAMPGLELAAISIYSLQAALEGWHEPYSLIWPMMRTFEIGSLLLAAACKLMPWDAAVPYCLILALLIGLLLTIQWPLMSRNHLNPFYRAPIPGPMRTWTSLWGQRFIQQFHSSYDLLLAVLFQWGTDLVLPNLADPADHSYNEAGTLLSLHMMGPMSIAVGAIYFLTASHSIRPFFILSIYTRIGFFTMLLGLWFNGRAPINNAMGCAGDAILAGVLLALVLLEPPALAMGKARTEPQEEEQIRVPPRVARALKRND
ncbi:hypothetical protein PAPYR_9567 [Paratrimastix pyriformis]|uniref:Uncharacterized protein n=1 Tax=Paratrimastix pyriformis TaxID=342808 RepID=A0ABQ8U828_9EUKA|nr:hypothetical protein PAPYR_9567 [Paratrimastix pyriformis]